MIGVSVLIPLAAGLPDLAGPPLMLVALAGWSLGTMNSIGSLSVVMAAASFRVPVEAVLFDRNLVFVAVFTLVLMALLGLLNHVLTG